MCDGMHTTQKFHCLQKFAESEQWKLPPNEGKLLGRQKPSSETSDVAIKIKLYNQQS